MNEYHDRTLDDPLPPAEDRPVAGWPGHKADPHTGERAGETPGEDEPLVGEVWNEQPAGEHESGTGWGGRHERTEEPAEGETAKEDTEDTETGRDHVGEPFGTEEPMIVAEPEGPEATPAAETGDEAAAESEPVAAVPETIAPVAATATEPEAEPVPESARPAAANEFALDDLMAPEAAERFRARWHDVKAMFVDDPADAVRQASALSGEAVDELTAALGRLRQELDGKWDEGRETDTELLRVALRGYGSLIDRILTR